MPSLTSPCPNQWLHPAIPLSILAPPTVLHTIGHNLHPQKPQKHPLRNKSSHQEPHLTLRKLTPTSHLTHSVVQPHVQLPVPLVSQPHQRAHSPTAVVDTSNWPNRQLATTYRTLTLTKAGRSTRQPSQHGHRNTAQSNQTGAQATCHSHLVRRLLAPANAMDAAKQVTDTMNARLPTLLSLTWRPTGVPASTA
jgi:hypothetical protein